MAAVGEIPVPAVGAVEARCGLVQQVGVRREEANEHPRDAVDQAAGGVVVALDRVDAAVPPVAQPHVDERHQRREAEARLGAQAGGEGGARDRQPAAQS